MKKKIRFRNSKNKRPRIYSRDVERIARLQPTHREIAAFLNVRLHVWKRLLATDIRIKDAYERGTQNGLLSLRRAQLRLASINPTMAIRLGEVWLGQKSVSRTELTGRDGQPLDLDVSKLNMEERNALRELVTRATGSKKNSE